MKKNPPKKKKNIGLYIVTGIILLSFIAYFILPMLSTHKEEQPTFTEPMFTKEGELVLTDSTGNLKAKIDIEVADSEYDRQKGLMFRRTMGEKQGMLFIFPVEEVQSFWMRNTYISLDMMYITKDMRIATIHKNTTILSDNSYRSSEPVTYVLETVAGFCDKYNIKPGDRISFIQ